MPKDAKELERLARELAELTVEERLAQPPPHPETPLEVRTDGEALIIRPQRKKRSRLEAAAERMMDAHDETLKKLAK